MRKSFTKYWKETVGLIVGAATIIGLIWGGINTLESRFASAADMEQSKQSIQKLNDRIDYNSISDRVYKIQERLWKLEDRYGADLEKPKGSKVEELLKEEYRKLKYEKNALEEQLDKMKVK